MKYIKPPEITGKILSLLDEANERIIIISPYNYFTGWDKLKKHLGAAVKRGFDIEYYIRAGEEKSRRQVESLGINPIEIPNLHAKLYMNENTAIVTSMNLHRSSDEKSLDIGFETENREEYDQLMSFCDTYIKRGVIRRISLIKIADIRRSVKHLKDDYIGVLHDCLQRGVTGCVFIRRGSILESKNCFVEGLTVILEPKSGYCRIDFRLKFPKPIKESIYHGLSTHEDQLTTEIQNEVSFGSQMKRIKIDINTDLCRNNNSDTRDLDERNRWYETELDRILGVFVRAVNSIVPRISSLSTTLIYRQLD